MRGPDSGLFAYDLDQAQWSRLADPWHPLLAIVYAADHDAIFAIAATVAIGTATTTADCSARPSKAP